jgi:DUF3054 family protein
MSKRILILGDVLVIALMTVIGFVSHGEAGIAFLPRMAAIYFPLSVSWFLLAVVLGLFRRETVIDPKQLWRPLVTGLFAAPLAAILRGFILHAPVIPVFAIVLGLTTALGMGIWRELYFRFNRMRPKE